MNLIIYLDMIINIYNIIRNDKQIIIITMSLIVNLKRSVSFAKHTFLKDLGIEQDNYGAYFNGKWQGSG